MRRNDRLGHVRLLSLLLMLFCVSLLAGCRQVDQLSEALYPTEPVKMITLTADTPVPPTPMVNLTPMPKQAPTWTPILQPTSLSAKPSVPGTGPSVSGTGPPMPPTPLPQPDMSQQLTFVQGGSLYRGDYFGLEAVEVASVPQLDAWDFYHGVVAVARGASLDIIDLVEGSFKSFQLQMDARVEYAQVLWDAAGKGFLYAALVDDKAAPNFGRSVELRAVSPKSGTELGRIRIQDVTGVNLLRYDQELGRMLLIPSGGDPAFDRVDVYDVRTGQLLQTLSVRGEGNAVISPNGQYLLTEHLAQDAQVQQLELYDLGIEGQGAPRVYQHPKDSHSISHVWAPNGRYVAYLLRDGLVYDKDKGLGLWVLDIETMQAKKVLEEASLSSSLVCWSEDSVYIVGYHRDETGGTYYYAVRPDGGDRHILQLDPDAVILGWTLATKSGAVPKVAIDPWRVRFMNAIEDPDGTAQVVADYVAERDQASGEALSDQVASYLQQAGWQDLQTKPSIVRVSKEISLAQLPPLSIYLLDANEAQLVASGHLILDARLEGDDLGLIFGLKSTGAVQPAYLLLRRQDDGTWRLLWAPHGQRDWIATDGEIRFLDEGLQALQVSGTSFGLDSGDTEVFDECHECPHRHLVATWARDGDRYVRVTDLSEGASLPEVYWEMTQRAPYAIVYESLRRMRQGLPLDDLVAEANVVAAQAGQLGLLQKGL